MGRGVARGQSKYMEESDNKGTHAILLKVTLHRTCVTNPGYASENLIATSGIKN